MILHFQLGIGVDLGSMRILHQQGRARHDFENQSFFKTAAASLKKKLFSLIMEMNYILGKMIFHWSSFECSLTKKSKVSLKSKLSDDDGILRLSASYAINTGDINLEACTTTASIGGIEQGRDTILANIHGLTIEKPGIFNIHYEYDSYRKGVFQFMNSFKVMDKPLRLTYQHQHVNNRTILDGALEFDSANMVSANYILGSEKCKFKYTYVHGGSTTFEQCYDTSKYSWDFMVSQRVMVSEDEEDLVVRATYQTSSKVLGLEFGGRCPWIWGWNGTSKLRASIDLKEEVKKAKFGFEGTLDLEM